MSVMGRPKKLLDGRLKITAYLNRKILTAIDGYVFNVKQGGNMDYSRSDFVNEAAEFYLAQAKERKRGEKTDGNRKN